MSRFSFSRPSIITFSAVLGFLMGLGLLFVISEAIVLLPISLQGSIVGLPSVFGTDLNFLIGYFTCFAAAGGILGFASLNRQKRSTEEKSHLNEHSFSAYQHSFTLIELLIVIAVIAVLATVVILTLNPAELMRKSRDANRLSDMKTLEQAIQLYSEDTGESLGTSSTLYLSVPDPDATSSLGDQCQGLGLSTSSLPAGWTYHCAGSDWYKNVDGTGWIPIDFKSSSFGSPVGTLPVDPVNATSSGFYYTYVGSGDPYELAAIFESQKYIPLEASDGGPDPAQYEVGTNLALSPFAHGLVGYWTFDEGNGTVAADSSGFSRNLNAAQGFSAWGTGQIGYAIETTGDTDGDWRYVPGQFPPYDSITILAWINSASSSQNRFIAEFGNGSSFGTYISQNANKLEGELWNSDGSSCGLLDSPASTILSGTWQLVGLTYDGKTETLYTNGTSVASQNVACSLHTQSNFYVAWNSMCGSNCSFDGLVDELRIYNAALSASEIQAIYNSEK